MARFQRSVPAPTLADRRNYQAYRPYVRRDFDSCCAYCLRHEDWAEAETFEIDHFRPQSRFPEEKYNYYNLYYACRRCNLRKLDYYPDATLLAAGVGFVDFCVDEFATHFEIAMNGMWSLAPHRPASPCVFCASTANFLFGSGFSCGIAGSP